LIFISDLYSRKFVRLQESVVEAATADFVSEEDSFFSAGFSAGFLFEQLSLRP